jgi:chorismate mutase
MELKDIRAEIDKIDDNIKKLLISRNEQTLSVAKAKASNKDLKILNTDRENEIISRLTVDLFDKNKIKNVMKSIFIESRTAQYKYFAENKLFNLNFDNKIVNKDVIDIDEIVLQGIEGSYAEQAATLFCNSKKSFEKDFEGVFKRVKGNTLGLVPIDNSTAGTVGEVMIYYKNIICLLSEVKI